MSDTTEILNEQNRIRLEILNDCNRINLEIIQNSMRSLSNPNHSQSIIDYLKHSIEKSKSYIKQNNELKKILNNETN